MFISLILFSQYGLLLGKGLKISYRTENEKYVQKPYFFIRNRDMHATAIYARLNQTNAVAVHRVALHFSPCENSKFSKLCPKTISWAQNLMSDNGSLSAFSNKKVNFR